MLTLIAFLLTILGCVNWLLIGLLQYDFIAGLFGFQASIFSRMVYILFGIGAVYLVLRVIINKGNFKVYESKKRREEMKKAKKQQIPTPSNVEAGLEQAHQPLHSEQHPEREQDKFSYINRQNDHSLHTEGHENLFDEHFEDDI